MKFNDSMRTSSVLSLIVCFLSLTSCEPDQKTTNEGSLAETEVSYNEFFDQFKPITPPYIVPASTDTLSTPLDKMFIEHFFANQRFSPAFGEQKDVPDLSENIERSTYFTEGIYRSDNFVALIIRKENEGNYYYLSTFSLEGVFISGLCIAFNEGTGDESIEREATINEDMSLQILQASTTGGSPGERMTAFFEIGTDGSILDINTDAPDLSM